MSFKCCLGIDFLQTTTFIIDNMVQAVLLKDLLGKKPQVHSIAAYIT